MSVLSIYNRVTMTSLELAEMVGVEHYDFLKKVPIVLKEGAGKFSCTYKSSQNKTLPMYEFPKRESCLMAMSYSYEYQAQVFDRMTAAEAKVEELTNALKKRYVLNLDSVPPWAFSALQLAETRFNWRLSQAGFALPDGCCPDISIGQGFCRHLRSLGYDTDKLDKYTHRWTNGREPVEANLYPNEWLTMFQTWFDGEWIPKYLKSDSLKKHLSKGQLAKCNVLMIKGTP